MSGKNLDMGLIKALQRKYKSKPNVIETHLSWLILTNKFVYKIKKPIDLGFADFTTLDKRLYFCQKELDLNRQLAPHLYCGLVGITGSKNRPHINGKGCPIEYAVKMKRFDSNKLFSELLKNNQLSSQTIESLAMQIAKYHSKLPAIYGNKFATYGVLKSHMLANFTYCRQYVKLTKDKDALQKLRNWTINSLAQLKHKISNRKKQGFIKQCHGDLHLENIAIFNQQITIFDCIEFNDSFSNIDTVNDIAFLAMDLLSRNASSLQTVFVNTYLQITNDYEGLYLLRLYMAYRALIRAKVALIVDPIKQYQAFSKYLHLAQQIAVANKPKLYIMYGLSASGKSYLSQQLANKINAIVLSSDLLRKHLSVKLYTKQAMHQIYLKLLKNAKITLTNNWTTIVDATFINKQHRQLYYNLAKRLDIDFTIIHCDAKLDTLQKRLRQRTKQNSAGSRATVAVLMQQLQVVQDLSARELQYAIELDTNDLQRAQNKLFRVVDVSGR